MGGWKEIHGTVLCSAPCCPGYTMKVERPPLLAPLVYCRFCTWVYSLVFIVFLQEGGSRGRNQEPKIKNAFS